MHVATIALYVLCFMLAMSGMLKMVGGPPYKMLKEFGYPGVFLRLLGAVEVACVAGLILFPTIVDAFTIYPIIAAIMGAAIAHHMLVEKKPAANVAPGIVILAAFLAADALNAQTRLGVMLAAIVIGYAGFVATVPYVRTGASMKPTKTQ